MTSYGLRLLAGLLFGLSAFVAIGAFRAQTPTHPDHSASASLLLLGDTGKVHRPLAPLLEGQFSVAIDLATEDRAHPVDALLLLGDNFYRNGLLESELAARVRVFDRAEKGNPSLAAVEQAIVERRVVEIGYVDKADAITTRIVEPVAVLGVQPHWYLWAFCRLRQAPRVFRLDRVRSATVLDESVPDRGLDPADIELHELINRGILGDVNMDSTNK